jgi:hypothetical protein
MKHKNMNCPCGCVDWTFSKVCGVWTCDNCGRHEGLVLCYCGWDLDGGDGYAKLIEAGETIEPEE